MAIIELEFYPELPAEDFQDAEIKMKKNMKNWDKPFFFEPRKHFDINEIKKTCDPILEEGIEHVIVLGTGGSIQTLLALLPFAEKTIHPISSSRPTELKKLFKIEDLKDKSVVIPISRGGKTIDINSLLYLFPRYKMIGLSSRGPMHNILSTMNVPTIEVPDLSGRFAASCTNVALLPAYMAGIDINAFVSGLEEGYQLYGVDNPIQTNISKQYALYLHYLFKNALRNVFSMPYFSWLEGAVGLWVQELSESTGKNGVGLMGTSQPAPLCQHSVLELLLGGTKYHSLPMLWNIEKDPDDLPLNNMISHIQGKTAAETVIYQANATFEALLTKEVPSAMLTLETPSVKNMGVLIAFIQSTVYHLCMLFDVDWAGNPNVLIGKEICNNAMADNLALSKMKENRKKVAREKLSNFWIMK
ncbi:MAG: hypothetical protein ACTSVI_06150 [Promethearchaeota archaeon]